MSRATLAAMYAMVLIPLCGCLPVELSVSGDGQVLIARQEGFCALDPGKGTVKNLYVPKKGKPAFALYAPDSKSFLAISSGFEVEVVSVGGEARKLTSAGNLTYAQWSGDGKYISLTRIAGGKVAPMDENLPELLLVDVAKGGKKTLLANVGTIHRWFADAKGVLALQIHAKDKDTGQYSGKLVRVDVATGKAKPLALVLGGKKVFLAVSPDGKKALFTAIKAAKVGEKVPASSKDSPKLFELDIAAGSVREVMEDVAFAIYSPKGTKVLLGSKKESKGTIELSVADASLAKKTVVAEDAAKSVGSTDSRDIYPGWIDENTVHYLGLRAVYGTEGKNVHLISVGADGKNPKDLQAAIDAGAK